MGMFDRFFFEDGILPNNKVPQGYEFQSKSLDCSLDTYEIDKHGNVNKFGFWEPDSEEEPEFINEIINDTVYVYSHEFIYEGEDILTRKYLGCKYQEYKLVIVNSKVAHVKKVREEGYESKEELDEY